MDPSGPSMDQESKIWFIYLAVCLFDELAIWFKIALYPTTKCIQILNVNFYVILFNISLNVSYMDMSHS